SIRPRAQRIASDTVSVNDALTLLVADGKKRAKWVQHALVAGLRHALGRLGISELRPVHLDDVCERWQAVGIEYPERGLKAGAKQHPMRPFPARRVTTGCEPSARRSSWLSRSSVRPSRPSSDTHTSTR